MERYPLQERGPKMMFTGGVLFALSWIHFPYRYFPHPRFDANV